MEKLTKKNGELSTELADQKEQKQRIEIKLMEETSQKIHAERELFKLREAVSKIKQERGTQSDPFAAMKEFEAPLWQKNKLLFSSDGKIQQLLKEETVVIDRIQSLDYLKTHKRCYAFQRAASLNLNLSLANRCNFSL